MGAVNDVMLMRKTLAAATLLTSDPFDPAKACRSDSPVSPTLIDQCATRQNIIDAWLNLIKASRPGDTLIFYYSGHGSTTGQPKPGEGSQVMDTIVPVDARAPNGPGDLLGADVKILVEAATARGRNVGLIPEIKHSTYFAGIGFPMEDRFIKALNESKYLATAPVIVQSFEIGNLKTLHAILGDRPNVQLMQLIDDDGLRPADVVKAGGTTTYAQMMSPEGLAAMAAYADWVAPWTRQLIPLGPDDKLGEAKSVIADAHRSGLLVGCYTFRPENQYLAADFRNDAGANARNPEGSVAEIKRYIAEGLDGFFTDDPALGRRAIDGAAA